MRISTARAVLIAIACLAAFAPSAGAANPPFFAQTPQDGLAGSEAGRLNDPFGIAVDPSNGHVYVGDADNNRVSEFTAWGIFVRAFGWGIADGSPEFQICTDTCHKGIQGSGVGQFYYPTGIATDEAGNLYVADKENLRVQKFAPNGDFLLMFGGGVNMTTGADVCTAADVANGDECGPGQGGPGPSQFENWHHYSEGRILAIGPSGDLYVGERGEIQVFGLDGVFKESIDFSEITGLPDVITKSLAIAPDGTLYLALFPPTQPISPNTPDVYEIDIEAREIVGKILVDRPEALSTDASGNLYVVSQLGTEREEILMFDPAGACVICPGDEFSRRNQISEARIGFVTTSDACGSNTIYVTYARGNSPTQQRSSLALYGDHPDPTICPPPSIPPTIAAQFASSVGTESAVLKAAINPHFWPGATYYLEYGTEDCAVSACQSQPAPPGNSLGDQVASSPVKTAGTFLQGLQPGTTYFYRFVAESGGGGPVIGPSLKFTTFSTPPVPPDSCANVAFRYGAGAALPDCRAYEMVSPLNKEGGDVMALRNVMGHPATMNQSAESGDRLTYSSARAFGDPAAGPYTSQYLATRGPGGWSTEPLNPPRNGPILGRGFTTDTEFKAFSPDLCLAWLRHDTSPPLADGVPDGYANFYRRDNCAGGGFEALRTPPPPPPTLPSNYEPELQGYSADGSVAIFLANAKLTPNAPPPTDGGRGALYESRPGQEPKYVCILPNGTSDTAGCSAGTYALSGGLGRSAMVQGAISDDGSLVYWNDKNQGRGKIYLRIGGQITVPVSSVAEAQTGSTASQFWAASPDGSKAILTTTPSKSSTPRLYEVEAQAGITTPIATQVKGVMGVSEDASDVYFVSQADLDAGGDAQAGKPNVYHYERSGEDRTTTFVMQVSPTDAGDLQSVKSNAPFPVSLEPVKHTAHVSGDGDHLAFASNVHPAPGGFDNADLESGQPAVEVYRYDAEADELHCVSCNRTGARPLGEEWMHNNNETGLWVAARIPAWQNQLHAPRVISADGNRLFFESRDVLVPKDTNGELDVYQWESPGTGGCSESLPSFNPAAGGCVDLISSGKSSFPSEFVDASPDGRDVFIATVSGLVPQDYGLIDVYDAREGGGFEPPPVPAPGCEGSACQSPPTPPQAPTPASATFAGPGSPSQSGNGRRCRKGKRLVKRGGKARCVKKKKKGANKGTRKAGGQGRNAQ